MTQKEGRYPEERYPHQGITGTAIRAALTDHEELGHGFTEPVYQEALEKELGVLGIPFIAQHRVPVSYRGRNLAKTFRPDFVLGGAVIVEIKAATPTALSPKPRRRKDAEKIEPEPPWDLRRTAFQGPNPPRRGIRALEETLRAGANRRTLRGKTGDGRFQEFSALRLRVSAVNSSVVGLRG